MGGFESYLARNIETVSAAKKKASEDKKRRRASAREYFLARLRRSIPLPKEIELVSAPPHVGSDFSLNVFALAKQTGRSPAEMAEKTALRLEKRVPYAEEVRAEGGFVNIKAKKNAIYGEILKEIGVLGARYGDSDEGKGKLVIIEYSSPNIAKPMGVGHLRSTVLGESLRRIYEKIGYTVIRDNHLGDWGTQFGALLYAYKNWHSPGGADSVDELKNLYVRFHNEAKTNPSLEDEARRLFSRLEEHDEEMVALWNKFRQMSIREFEEAYRRLGVSFDTQIGEGFFAKDAANVVSKCLKKGVCAKKEDGAVAVENLNGLPSFLLAKQDGSTLYLTRDLATVKFRVEEFRPDAVLYVVGGEQELHFKQLFALAKKMGCQGNTKLLHVAFGLILADGKKMSTRGGTSVELEDVLNEAKLRARKILDEKEAEQNLPGQEEFGKDALAEVIGTGAVVYRMLKQSRMQNISFDWEEMLNLEGGSAVYLQYSHARARSILEKLGDSGPLTVRNPELSDESEWELAKKIMFFPSVVLHSACNNSPHFIATYLEELAQLFNHFYHRVPVIKAESENLKALRAALTRATADTLKEGLRLLAVAAPTRM